MATRKRHGRGLPRGALGTLSLALGAVLVLALGPGAAATVTPTYSATVGGPGHAEMYPSGVDVDSSGNIYVADTGNGRITSYTPAGVRRWATSGTPGTRQLGAFNNPRDVAFLNG